MDFDCCCQANGKVLLWSHMLPTCTNLIKTNVNKLIFFKYHFQKDSTLALWKKALKLMIQNKNMLVYS